MKSLMTNIDTPREPLVTKQELTEQINKQRRQVWAQKQIVWAENKTKIDAMCQEQLADYLASLDKTSAKTGTITARVSVEEYAKIRLAMFRLHARSVRDMIIQLVDEKLKKELAHEELKQKIQSGLASGLSSQAIDDIVNDFRKKHNIYECE